MTANYLRFNPAQILVDLHDAQAAIGNWEDGECDSEDSQEVLLGAIAMALTSIAQSLFILTGLQAERLQPDE
ncbi:MAG: hypothetical protein H0U59_00510 [Gemmatimonadaceae bacterium]|nr:hypothetical protein [Gemmatimonadaceae bacterium]